MLFRSSNAERQFFVRVQGTKENCLEKVEEYFGTVDVVSLDNVKDEFGFVTGVMTEQAYKEAANQFDNIIGMIRIEG